MQAFHTLLLEHKVADRKHLIHHQQVRRDLGCDGKAEAGHHAGGKVFDRHINKIPEFGKINDVVEVFVHISAIITEHRAVQVDILTGGQVHIKPGAKLNHRRNGPVHGTAALARVHHAGHDLEHCALARTVAPDQRDRFALVHREADILEGVKLIKHELAAQHFDKIFLEGFGFFLGEVEPH